MRRLLVNEFARALRERPADFSISDSKCRLVDAATGQEWWVDTGCFSLTFPKTIKFGWLDWRRGRRALNQWKRSQAPRIDAEDEALVCAMIRKLIIVRQALPSIEAVL